ncbi:hypothetical protein BJ508DRAFT_335266 [Ascobolus immersus RN42]|uniref:F-box domain-containing protein n=1 Tax=Ascobolus immersus RN42 TaxID=1160509 RepID=A0A3N4HD41_ASCIM|nr:hypothetical protein BJ508DRAFT_335266 [Ascobolus immersus RN42]
MTVKAEFCREDSSRKNSEVRLPETKNSRSTPFLKADKQTFHQPASTAHKQHCRHKHPSPKPQIPAFTATTKMGRKSRSRKQLPFKFLMLPLELRLEIYEYCTVFSLLILTHTCRTFYTDINSRLAFVGASKGYNDYKAKFDYEHEYFERSPPHPLLPNDTVPLCIPMMCNIDKLDCNSLPRTRSEVDTFNCTYSTQVTSYIVRKGWCCCVGKGWWCCASCHRIKRQVEDYPEEYTVARARTTGEEQPIEEQPSYGNILRLPLDLRLTIYDHCTVFNLLILSHTCRTFYTDINNRQALVGRSKGYAFRHLTAC